MRRVSVFLPYLSLLPSRIANLDAQLYKVLRENTVIIYYIIYSSKVLIRSRISETKYLPIKLLKIQKMSQLFFSLFSFFNLYKNINQSIETENYLICKQKKNIDIPLTVVVVLSKNSYFIHFKAKSKYPECMKKLFHLSYKFPITTI